MKSKVTQRRDIRALNDTAKPMKKMNYRLAELIKEIKSKQEVAQRTIGIIKNPARGTEEGMKK